MKFSHYLDVNSRDIWRSQYIKYKELKKLLHEVLETGAPVVVPHALSFSIKNGDLAAALQQARTPQERFFIELESQVAVVNSFTQAQAQLLRHQLRLIEVRLKALTCSSRTSSHGGTQQGQAAILTGPLDERAPSSPVLRTHLRRGVEHGHVRVKSLLSGPAGSSQAALPQAIDQQGAAAAGSSDGCMRPLAGQLPRSRSVNKQQEGHTHAVKGPSSADAAAGILAANEEGLGGSSGTGAGGVNLTRAVSVAAMPPQPRDKQAEWAQLQADARTVGLEYLALEKYVNLNYAALQKILKKHDKLLPSAPCWGFYRIHTSHQPWVRGEHHDIQATLARIFTQLHAAARLRRLSGPSNVPGPSSLHAQQAHHADSMRLSGTSLLDPQMHSIEHTRKFWVRAEDIAEFEYHVLQHMPVRAPDIAEHRCVSALHVGDCMHKQVNMLYLDNSSLELYHNLLYGRPYAALVRLLWEGDGPLRPADRVLLQRKVYRDGWQPDTAIKDGLPLEAHRVAEFLAGRWTFADARKYLLQQQQQRSDSQNQLAGSGSTLRPQGLAAEMEATAREYALFKTYTEVQRLVETKALQPVVTIRMRQTLYEDPDALAASISRHDGISSREPQQAEVVNTDIKTGMPMSAMPPSAIASAAGGEEEGTSSQDMAQDMAPRAGQQAAYGESQRQDGGASTSAAQRPAQVAVVRRIQLDSHVRALLEYSYDGLARIAHGLWHQKHHTDAVDLPYGCVTVALQPPGGVGDDDADSLLHPAPLPRWLQSMVDSGKLLEVPDFSKFLFGCAGLLPDMVRAVPVWIDDPLVARFLTAQIFGHHQQHQQHGNGSHQAGGNGPHHQATASAPSLLRQESHRTQVIRDSHDHQDSGDSSRKLKRSNSGRGNGHPTAVQGQEASRAYKDYQTGTTSSSHARQAPGGHVADHKALESSSKSLRTTWSAPVLKSSTSQGRSSSMMVSGVPQGWQLKLLARQQSKGRVYAPQALFIEPAQFLRSERIFVTWLTMTITLSGFACGMLGFAASSIKDPQVWHMYLVEWTSFALLTVAIAMCVYGLAVYTWRNHSLYELRPHRYDDVRGSLSMNLVWVMTLLTLLLLNIYDLVEVIANGGSQGGGGGDDDGGDYQPPPPPFMPPPYPAPPGLYSVVTSSWSNREATGIDYTGRSLQQRMPAGPDLSMVGCGCQAGVGPVTQQVQQLVCMLLRCTARMAGIFGRR